MKSLKWIFYFSILFLGARIPAIAGGGFNFPLPSGVTTTITAPYTFDSSQTFNASMRLGLNSTNLLSIYGYILSYSSITVNQDINIGSTTRMNGNITAGDGPSDTLSRYAYEINYASAINHQNVIFSSNVVLTPQTALSCSIASAIITPTGKFQLVGSSGAVTMVGTPTITAGTDGQELILISTSPYAITLQDGGTLASSGLELNATTVDITTSTPIKFISYGSVWYKQ